MTIDAQGSRIVFGQEETQPVFDNDPSLPANEWSRSFLAFIETAPIHQEMDITVPESVDYESLFVELGLAQRDFEIGGLFNLRTRSMLVSRGAGRAERNYDQNPQIQMPRYRRNADGSTNDIHFHTHPWDVNATISYLRDPTNTCEPSDTDTNSAFGYQMIEEEAGQDTQVISYVSSGGYITKTEVSGVRIDAHELRAAGVTQAKIDNLLSELALRPNRYLVNYARDSEAAKLMMREVVEFYKAKKVDTEIPFTRKLRALQERITQYCDNGYVERIWQNKSEGIILDIENHFPKYQDKRDLLRMGLSPDQVELAHKMEGVKITKYKQTPDGLEAIGEI